MTAQMVDAVYEHGTFRLIQPSTIAFHEGLRVRLMIDAEPAPDAMLSLAASVYDGLAEQDLAEVESLTQRRAPFFGDRS